MGEVLSIAENEQADIIIFGFYTLPAGAPVSTAERNKPGYRVSAETCHSFGVLRRQREYYGFLNILNGEVWNKIYRREVLSRFTPGVVYCEDFKFAVETYCRSRSIILTGIYSYYYVTNPQSTVSRYAATELQNMNLQVLNSFIVPEGIFHTLDEKRKRAFAIMVTSKSVQMLFSILGQKHNVYVTHCSRNLIKQLAPWLPFPVKVIFLFLCLLSFRTTSRLGRVFRTVLVDRIKNFYFAPTGFTGLLNMFRLNHYPY